MATTIRVYVGNLSGSVTKEELSNLFGLEATPYLRSSCWVELASKQSGESKGFAFANVPEHIAQELLKFNGIDFYGRPLQIEPAKTNGDDSKGKDKVKEEKGKVTEGEEKEGKEKAKDKDGDSKETKKTSKKPKQSNRGGGGGGYRYYRGSSRGGRGQFRRGPVRSKFNLPVLEADQVYQMIDGGVNLVNGKFAQNTDYVIARALASGVQKMVVTGNRLNGSRSAVVMAKTRPNILYAAIGIHPHHVKDDWNDFTISVLEDLIKLPEVVAIGEVGLDFHRNYTPKEAQKKAFEKQVELACKVQKPLLVHDRDAHESVIEVLDKFKTQLPSVVIHCFTGGADEVKAYLARGYYIGLTGYICKEKYGKPLRDVLEQGILPIDRICIQTDAPYMIPSMARTEMDPVSQKLLSYCNEGYNEPCTLSVIVKCIAKCVGKDPKDVVEVLTETTRNIFNFDQKEGIELEK